MKTTLLILVALVGVSTAAQAQPPEFASRNRIQYLAYELAEAAHRAHTNAEFCATLRRSTRALEAVHDLDRKARVFSRQVKRSYRHPYRTRHAYWDLVESFRYAKRHMRHGHTAEVVLQDMYRVERLLRRVAYVYEGTGRHGYYGSTWHNDHFRGDDYDDDRYYGKKSKGRKVKPPHRSRGRR